MTHPLTQVRKMAVDVARAQEDILSRTDWPRVYFQSSVFARGSGANADGQLDGGVSGLGLDRVNWAAGVQVVFPNAFDFTSLRTGFVHLTIDGVDQGLYEWVEEPDETFLASHGLNPGGALYKAKKFSFDPIDSATAADKTKVSQLVASKGTPDLAKLRRMIAAVNDVKQPINDVRVVHDFVPNIDRSPEELDCALHDVDGPIDARTESTWVGQKNFHTFALFAPWLSRQASYSRNTAPTVIAESATLNAGNRLLFQCTRMKSTT